MQEEAKANPRWSAIEDDHLIEAYKEGISARGIADELAQAGFVVTRNGVLGRVHRLRKAGKLDVPLRQAPTRGAPGLARRLLPLRRPGEKPKADGCRFIEGEPNGALTVYCEAPLVHPLDSYCAAHHARCYQRKDQADAGKGRGQFVVFGGLGTNGGKVRQVPAAKTLAGMGV